MTWLVDGSNVLGALRWNRESRETKERLATLCARFARRARTKVVLCFDGVAPSGFARKLGGLSVRFAHPRSADEIIIELARERTEPCTVVSSDQGIARRVRRRAVDVVSSRDFASKLLALLDLPDEGDEGTAAGDDWDDYFSDPKNRIF